MTVSEKQLRERVENLERIKEQKDGIHRIFVVSVDARNPKGGSSYINEKCEAACDKETYENALGAAFVEIKGMNPLENEGISFIDVTEEIALKTAENLRAAGIEVEL